MTRTSKRFSFWKYSALVVLQFAVLLLGMRVLLPGVWASQITAGTKAIILVFIGTHLFNCFIEWGFHRYVLHAVPVAWLGRFARKHRRHHSLTPIRLRQEGSGRGRTILNRYPIVSREQYESASFPTWSLVLSWGLFTPFLAGLQFWFPKIPFLFGGYAAVVWSLACYEIFHHIEHFPFPWWERRIAHPRFGALWKKVYGFHHMHHANVGCNEAISGFFGFPIADWLFRTYRHPREIFLDGHAATAKNFAVPQPRRFVRRLDRWARKREKQQARHAL